jgi:long-chain acyl-CoA synthetase
VNNIYQILENTTANNADNVALCFGEYKISYKDVKEATDRLARGLKDLGLAPGDRMALMLPNVPHFPMSYFALLKIGVTVVPVSILSKAEEVHYQLKDSEIQGIIFWEGFRPIVRQTIQGLEKCEKLIVLGEKPEVGEVRLTYLMEIKKPLEETIEVKSDDTALIVYTAGTTGGSKGAELTHSNIMSNVDACCEFLKIGPEDCVVGVLPFYHLLGQTLTMNTFLRVGARIILMAKFNAEAVLKSIEEEKPTYFVGVPSMFQEILKVENGEKIDVSFLKFCLSIGDAMTQETMETFEEKFKVPILEGYGLTEASPVVSFNSPQRERGAGSIGLPLPGIEMKIVDETDSEVKPGQVGEIIIQGPNVMKGYKNRPEATNEALKGGWLRTGDLALLRDDGFGYIVVRKKNVIVKSGFNVYPREVEKLLVGHPQIKEAVVVGIPDPVQGEEIHACIVLNEGGQITQEEIVEYCNGQITAYKCPKFVHFVSALPKGPTGKVMREEVKQSLMENQNNS